MLSVVLRGESRSVVARCDSAAWLGLGLVTPGVVVLVVPCGTLMAEAGETERLKSLSSPSSSSMRGVAPSIRSPASWPLRCRSGIVCLVLWDMRDGKASAHG